MPGIGSAAREVLRRRGPWTPWLVACDGHKVDCTPWKAVLGLFSDVRLWAIESFVAGGAGSSHGGKSRWLAVVGVLLSQRRGPNRAQQRSLL